MVLEDDEEDGYGRRNRAERYLGSSDRVGTEELAEGEAGRGAGGQERGREE